MTKTIHCHGKTDLCLTIVWGCAEILPLFVFKSNLIGRDFVDITALSLGRGYTFP